MQLQEDSARVTTFRLAAALEQYDMDVRRLVSTWLDLELYRRLQQQVKELRLYSASLPKLSVCWVAVLVSRTRMLHGLCSRRGPAAAALLQEHLDVVAALRARCLRLIGATGPVLA
jgi:hypothetical protein